MVNFRSPTLLLLLISVISCASKNNPHPLSDEFIDLLNKEQRFWRAGRNFDEDTSMEYIKTLMGVAKKEKIYEDKLSLDTRTHDPEVMNDLPEHFDPRAKWPECPTLDEVRDQGACTSCWAVATAAAVTDRFCIYRNSSKDYHENYEASAQDMLGCSGCMVDNCRTGGYVECAWKYWAENGIVTGGPYNSSEGCKPYEIKPCEHIKGEKRKPLCTFDDYQPKCVKKCREGYRVPYQKDKSHGSKTFSVKGEDHIKAELFKNGPLVAALTVYEDFLAYKRGIYRYHIGKDLGDHAVKLMGWGVENGTKYWLIANSWNTDFGENGFFRIVRGENNCGIEDSVSGGDF